MGDEVLLPGEDPGNIQNGDAEHWISVYQELLAPNHRLLNQMQTQGGPEMDTQPLERYVQRLERRLAFWKERLA